MRKPAIKSRLQGLWRSPLNRLACLFSLALFLTYLLITGLAALGVINQALSTRTGLINAEIEGLDQIYEDEDIPGLIDAINERVRAPRDPHAVYALMDAQGKILAGQFNHLPTLARKPGWISFEWRQHGQASQSSAPSVHIDAFVQVLEDDELLLAGRDTSEQRRVFDFAYDLGIAALLTMALAAMALAYAFRRAIDAALRGPLETVHRFSMGSLAERVARNGSLDSFDQLGATLNSMLDRIQDLIGGIVHSTDAIAHDLRTPLSRLRTNLESLREKTQTPEAADKVDAAIREAEQLMSRFAALLRLARIESEDADAAALNSHQAFDFAEIVADAAELWLPVAEEKSQTIRTTLAPATVTGDRDQLFQLVSNLLDNAIKYSPTDAHIEVSTVRTQGQVTLRIQDSGPGIPELDRERVFDRFVRLDADRSSPGIGLGLSLVRAIAVRHGATILLSDNAPGLAVEICFSH